MPTPSPWALRAAATMAVLPSLILKMVGGLDHRPLPFPATVVLVLVSAAYVAFWLTGGSGRAAQILTVCAAASSVAAALLPGTPTYMTFLWVYTAVMVGFVIDVRRAVLAEIAVVGLAVATSIAAAGAVSGGWPVAAARSAEVALIVPVAGLAAISVAQLLRSNVALADARDSLARLAVQEERNRFSRDLHDALGQTLSLVGIKVQLARRLIGGREPEADPELSAAEGLIRDALDAVREVASGYRQPTLASQLSGARAALAAAGIRLTVEGAMPLLPPEVEGAMAWMVREGATNVIRHSHARNCWITFRRQREAITVEIVDDGVGLTDGGPEGLGLHSLRERLEPLGATLRCGPGATAGYVLSAEVPCGPEAAR